MNRIRILVPLVAAAAALGVVAPAAADASPSCSTDWGSRPKSVHATEPGQDLVTGVRAGRHACFDRVVVDVAGVSGLDAWSVGYVPAVHQEGSGAVVPLRGGADLQVSLGARGYDDQGHATYAPARPREAVDVRGYTTLRQVAWLGSSEGRSAIGVGTRARLPFRVTVLPGGSTHRERLVVDVAHRWQG